MILAVITRLAHSLASVLTDSSKEGLEGDPLKRCP